MSISQLDRWRAALQRLNLNYPHVNVSVVLGHEGVYVFTTHVRQGRSYAQKKYASWYDIDNSVVDPVLRNLAAGVADVLLMQPSDGRSLSVVKGDKE